MRRVFFSIMLLSAAVIIAGCGKKDEGDKDKDADATSAMTLEANQVRLDVTGMS